MEIELAISFFLLLALTFLAAVDMALGAVLSLAGLIFVTLIWLIVLLAQRSDPGPARDGRLRVSRRGQGPPPRSRRRDQRQAQGGGFRSPDCGSRPLE